MKFFNPFEVLDSTGSLFLFFSLVSIVVGLVVAIIVFMPLELVLLGLALVVFCRAIYAIVKGE
jgi:hypothetical protein